MTHKNDFYENKDEMKKICYQIAENNNWDLISPKRKLPVPYNNFIQYIKLYIQENNIKPTAKHFFFFLNYFGNNQNTINCYKKIIQCMIDEGILKNDLNNIYEKICYFCCDMKINEKRGYCEDKGIPFDIVCHIANIYIRQFLKSGDFSEDKMMKICYDKYDENDWDKKRIISSIKMTLDESRKYVYKYIKEVLHEELNEKQILVLISSQSKILFNNYDRIIKLMLKEKVISAEQYINPYWLDENLRMIICKYSHDLFNRFNWDLKELQDFCIKEKISYSQVKYLNSEYIENYLSEEHKQEILGLIKGASKKAYRDGISKRYETSFYVLMLDKLMESDDLQKVVELFESNHVSVNYLKNQISPYLMYHNNLNYTKDEIEKKLQLYSDYLISYRKERDKKVRLDYHQSYIKDNIDAARKIINEYLSGEYERMQDFCDAVNLDMKKVEEYIALVKENDVELYSRYCEKSNNIKSRRFSILKNKALSIVKFIKEGIEENGVNREFDLVDYYKYTKINFAELLNIINGSISAEDYRLLKIFIAKNRNDKQLSPLDLKKIYETKVIVGTQFDLKGKAIPGTGREITKEEKNKIIGYLKRNNIPLTQKTYGIVYRRWLKGNLILDNINDDDKNKVK